MTKPSGGARPVDPAAASSTIRIGIRTVRYLIGPLSAMEFSWGFGPAAAGIFTPHVYGKKESAPRDRECL
jgi:hypothetical protein